MPRGKVVEINFNGVHEDGHGNQMADYIRLAVEEHRPSAILLNLTDYQYRWGNDMGGLIVAVIDRGKEKLRPSAIIASGRTHDSLRSLFGQAQVLADLPLRLVGNRNDAITFLKSRLDERTG